MPHSSHCSKLSRFSKVYRKGRGFRGSCPRRKERPTIAGLYRFEKKSATPRASKFRSVVLWVIIRFAGATFNQQPVPATPLPAAYLWENFSRDPMKNIYYVYTSILSSSCLYTLLSRRSGVSLGNSVYNALVSEDFAMDRWEWKYERDLCQRGIEGIRDTPG